MSHRRPLARVLLGGALVGGGALAVTGGLALSGPALVAVGLVAALAGCTAAGIAREASAGARTSALEAAVSAVGLALTAMLVAAGIATLAGGGVAAVSVAAGLVAFLVVRLVRGRHLRSWAGNGATAARGRAEPTAGTVLRLPVTPLPREAGVLTTRDLGAEWVRTTAALAGRLDAASRQALVARRESVLDELERRDADGFARWLAAGPTPGSNPADFVRDGPTGRGPAADTDAA